jgi:uncharacterized BrkB/YihY/UPF0761 family membrane protein
VSKPGDNRTGRLQKWIAGARRYQQRLERRPWVAFPLESVRRFNKIDGKHLALVIALNLFVAVIPLIIIGYAFIEAFNPRRDVGNLIVGNLHLTGSTAQIVRATFTNASSGKSVALSISLISLLITGLDVSATAQVAYARAFTMAPLHGIQKYLRGAAWLILLLAGTGAALTLRFVAASHPAWVAIVAGAVLVALQFGFFLVSPRLLLDLPFAWRDLIPGAAICTGAAIVVHTPCRRCSCATGSAYTVMPTAASASAWRWPRSSVSSPPSGCGSPP